MQRIKDFPVALFTSIMRSGCLAIAYQRYETIFGFPQIVSMVLFMCVYVIFSVIGGAYISKLIFFKDHVVAEFYHQVQANFFAAISMGVLVLGIATYSLWPLVAFSLWLIGSIGHVSITVILFSRWLTGECLITITSR